MITPTSKIYLLFILIPPNNQGNGVCSVSPTEPKGEDCLANGTGDNGE